MNTPAQLPETEARYDARWQRILDCVALRQPDRMPVVMYGTYWFAKYGGISCKELMYDYEKNKEITERAVLEFEPDAVAPLFGGTALGKVFDALDYKQLQWPGHGVGDNQPYQYLDREYMKAEEFPDFLRDPTGFYLNSYLPRIFGAFEGFENFPVLPGMFYFRAITGLRPLANPEFRKALRRVLDAAEVVDSYMTESAQWNRRIASLGFPLTNGSASGAPYDVLADYFRGATGMMKDLFRRKEVLLEAIDSMRQHLVKMTIANARASGNPIVFIPVHWASDAFMSQKQFETFWWPSFRQMMHRPDRCRPDPHAAVGIGLHQAPGDHQGYPGRQVHLLVRAHRHRQGSRGAGRRGGPAGEYLAVTDDHRHAGRGRRRGEEARGQDME